MTPLIYTHLDDPLHPPSLLFLLLLLALVVVVVTTKLVLILDEYLPHEHKL